MFGPQCVFLKSGHIYTSLLH